MLLSRLYHTIKYLKPVQVIYQLKYRLRDKLGFMVKSTRRISAVSPFSWKNFIWLYRRFEENGKFTFVNLSRQYPNGNIEWNDSTHGKLWIYNLNYFDFLHQEKMTKETGQRLMVEFVEAYEKIKDGKEPYPTSLRIMNWIKFVNMHLIRNDKFDDIIHQDSSRLLHNLEYHLLANHLLENGFALLFAGVYLDNFSFYNKGKEIVESELKEQILSDGAHFEQSPMYHQLMLYRVLDCIQLVRNAKNSFIPEDLDENFNEVASKMLSWLENISFSDGCIPLVNDSALNIHPTTGQLQEYCTALNVSSNKSNLGESGYRKRFTPSYELFLDIGDLQSSYQPGHSHADTFSYLLHTKDKPFIVESGTATYENNERRQYERSTAAHNTVVIDEKNSSEVWSSFRVANRANVLNIQEAEDYIIAEHDGYGDIVHKRKWEFQESQLSISDTLSRTSRNAVSYIHFHPSIILQNQSRDEVTTDIGKISFSGHNDLSIGTYEYAEEFNITQVAKVLKISFQNSMKTTIQLN